MNQLNYELNSERKPMQQMNLNTLIESLMFTTVVWGEFELNYSIQNLNNINENQMDKSHSQVDKKSKNDERKTSSSKLNDYENTS